LQSPLGGKSLVRNIVVTGGTRGIGFAIAQTLMRADYHVIVIARNPPENSYLDSDGGVMLHRHSFVSWDLAETDTFAQLGGALRNIGPIYGLVNNAGIGPSGILTTMPNSRIAQVMHMNVVAPMTLTKFVIRSMLMAQEGRVINISSIVARTGYQGLAVYSASKAALEGFTRSLAREVGPVGITVNAVAPGFVDTEMTHGLDEKHRSQIARRSALQRMANADDIANAVAFLMSDAAANITGTVMTVDAGNTA
jgi:3-oxoacyl-[acyl-carrier protein] reductase